MHPKALQAYRTERDALVERIRQVLEADRRVRAAWLWGSLGRGTADALSDVDVWVVVQEASLPEIAARRRDYVAQIGAPLAIVEAPQNAPERGAYLLAVYAGEAAPHQVDWYWQAQAAARVPVDARLLLERVALPRTQAAPSFPGAAGPARSPVEQIGHAIHFFWAMLLVVARRVARSPHAPEIELLELVQAPLLEVQALVGATQTGPAPHSSAAAAHWAGKLAVLRDMAASMEALMPPAAERGAALPRPEIAGQARRYLDMVEAGLEMPEQGGQNDATAVGTSA